MWVSNTQATRQSASAADLQHLGNKIVLHRAGSGLKIQDRIDESTDLPRRISQDVAPAVRWRMVERHNLRLHSTP